MDLATIIGLLLGVGALLMSMVIEGVPLTSLINMSAMVLVFGGSFGASMIGFPLKHVLSAVSIAKNAFINKAEDPRDVIKQMVDFTRKARREGILVLEEEARTIENRILRIGIQLIVDGTPDDVVRSILETEVIGMQERHKQGARIFDAMGGFAPTMGVIGTVMGLVNMLNHLSDPGKMGPMIASAFIATFYGVSYANLVLLPIGQKLKSRSAEEVAIYEMMIEGILSIQAGDNPRVVETKMIAFCPPKMRESLDTSEGA